MVYKWVASLMLFLVMIAIVSWTSVYLGRQAIDPNIPAKTGSDRSAVLKNDNSSIVAESIAGVQVLNSLVTTTNIADVAETKIPPPVARSSAEQVADMSRLEKTGASTKRNLTNGHQIRSAMFAQTESTKRSEDAVSSSSKLTGTKAVFSIIKTITAGPTKTVTAREKESSHSISRTIESSTTPESLLETFVGDESISEEGTKKRKNGSSSNTNKTASNWFNVVRPMSDIDNMFNIKFRNQHISDSPYIGEKTSSKPLRTSPKDPIILSFVDTRKAEGLLGPIVGNESISEQGTEKRKEGSTTITGKTNSNRFKAVRSMSDISDTLSLISRPQKMSDSSYTAEKTTSTSFKLLRTSPIITSFVSTRNSEGLLGPFVGDESI